MHPAHQRQHPRRLLPHPLGRQRLAGDEAGHQDAGLGVLDLGRDPGGGGGAAGRQLVEAQDVVVRDVGAQPHDMGPGGVVDPVVAVGQPAGQRGDGDAPAPAAQPRDDVRRLRHSRLPADTIGQFSGARERRSAESAGEGVQPGRYRPGRHRPPAPARLRPPLRRRRGTDRGAGGAAVGLAVGRGIAAWEALPIPSIWIQLLAEYYGMQTGPALQCGYRGVLAHYVVSDKEGAMPQFFFLKATYGVANSGARWSSSWAMRSARRSPIGPPRTSSSWPHSRPRRRRHRYRMRTNSGSSARPTAAR